MSSKTAGQIDRSVAQIAEQIVEAPRIIPQEYVLWRAAVEDIQEAPKAAMIDDETSEHDACRVLASTCEESCETSGLAQGGSAGVKWMRHEGGTWLRKWKVSICTKWRRTWRPVAHTFRPRQRSESRSGPKTCARIRRIVEFPARRDRKLGVQADVAVRRLERLEKENPSWKTKSTKPASWTLSRTKPKSRSSSSTCDSSTQASAVAKSLQAKSSSSTPASSQVPKSSPSARTRGCRLCTTTLKPRRGGIEHAKLGDTPRGKRRERQRHGEGEQSGATSQTSSSVDGRTGSKVGGGSLRDVQPPSRLPRQAGRRRTSSLLSTTVLFQ